MGIDRCPAGKRPAAALSASGPGSGDLLPGPPGHHPRPFQPLRAALVIVLAVVVGVFVLDRTGGTPTTAATHLPPTSARTTVPHTPVTTPKVVTTSTTTTTTTPTTTLPPSKVTVLVLNGWNVRHAALFFQHKLAADGYDTLAPTNATSETNKTSQLFVISPGDGANALAIAAFLGLPSSTVITPTPANDSAIPATMLHQADLVLVVGGDISKEVPNGYNG
ncbi:MAG: LytR C-terminal domain-containing protein [Acidimicrobiales bacterium]